MQELFSVEFDIIVPIDRERLKIKIFNREICVCALLATNSLIHFMDLAISWLCATKLRRNEGKHVNLIVFLPSFTHIYP